MSDVMVVKAGGNCKAKSCESISSHALKLKIKFFSISNRFWMILDLDSQGNFIYNDIDAGIYRNCYLCNQRVGSA